MTASGKPLPTKGSTSEPDSLAVLRAENERLIGLLEANGIEWRPTPEPAMSPPQSESSRLSAEAKVALFRRRFQGRTDVYPVRWESRTTGKSGYAPACANEWRAGVCEKPLIKCGDCPNRSLIPLSDASVYAHLAGDQTIGVYPLLEDDSCYFLAIDFDEAEWREDVRAFAGSCADLGVPVAVETSRETGRTPGSSSQVAYRPGTPVGWAPPSSVTPARARGNWSSRPTTDCFPIRTPCPRAALAI